MSDERRDDALALADLAAQGADPHQIAAAAVAEWQRVYAVLSPIIGARGMCALYERSLHIARSDLSWLGAVHATALDSGNFDALRKALSQQPATIGAAAHHSLLTVFSNLLSQLIGESLTARLLSNVRNGTSTPPDVAGK